MASNTLDLALALENPRPIPGTMMYSQSPSPRTSLENPKYGNQGRHYH